VLGPQPVSQDREVSLKGVVAQGFGVGFTDCLDGKPRSDLGFHVAGMLATVKIKSSWRRGRA
jgi:hypothetical protein